MGHANLIAAMESNYGITLDLDEALLIETITEIKRILDDKGITYE